MFNAEKRGSTRHFVQGLGMQQMNYFAQESNFPSSSILDPVAYTAVLISIFSLHSDD